MKKSGKNKMLQVQYPINRPFMKMKRDKSLLEKRKGSAHHRQTSELGFNLITIQSKRFLNRLRSTKSVM